MSNNINTLKINTDLFSSKINELAQSLNIINQSTTSGQTKEELIIGANKLLRSFYDSLSSSIFNPNIAIANTQPQIVDFNNDLQNILSDLNILFSELPNVGTLAIGNFDFIVTATNKLISQLKMVDSKLGDYILFSTDATRDSIYTSDSFNDFSKIDNNSSSLNNTQCTIDTDQGVVLLPLAKSTTSDIQITELPSINSNSNGTVGNNYEAGAQLNSNIAVILDGNADTWFEYERVIFNQNDNVPLILDITLNLSTPQIINFIRVNPNNFGTKNNITITDISTSADGKDYLSIKDDIPLSSFRTEDEDNIFVLTPATSKFAGEGIYSFLPRTAKYVHLTFVQNSTYSIIDKNGIARQRYAIGIRDIEIAQQQFESVGEFISANYSVNDEIKKVSLSTTQNPIETSALANIEHYISVDSGLTWNRLEPTNFINDNITISQILNFNTVDVNSITTSAPVETLKYKAILRRNSDAFQSIENSIIQKPQSVSELFTIPTQSPFVLRLDNVPSDNNIVVMDPFFGSCGFVDTRYKLGVGTGDQLIIQLPADFIKLNFVKVTNSATPTSQFTTNEIIRVNGVIWTKANLLTAGPADQVYELDLTNNQIKFGDNVNGKVVPANNIIDIMFTSERLFINDNINRIAKLNYKTSNDKDSVEISYLASQNTISEKLKLNSNKQILSNKHILPKSIKLSDNAIYAHEVIFKNGSVELTDDGQYSVDYVNGIIYSKLSTSSFSATNITYTYSNSGQLSSDDWDFINDGEFNKLTIKNDSVFSISVSNENNMPIGVNYFILNNQCILRNTVVFNETSRSTFITEVDYIDGESELSLLIKTTEAVPVLSRGLHTFPLKLKVASDYISFSDAHTFNSKVPSLDEVNGNGKYYLDIAANTVTVFVASTSAANGNVSYFYSNQDVSNNGLYSINYKTGEVFTASPTQAGTSVNYSYTNYFISYKVARFVSVNDFTYDKVSNSVTLNEREILQRTNNGILNIGNTQSNFYQLVFNTLSLTKDELKNIEPYFSPILKDYAIRIITESLLLL